MSGATGSAAATGRPALASAIYFWSDDPHPSLWRVAAGGGTRERVGATVENAKRPVLSPDGRWIAFDGGSAGASPMSNFNIQLIRPDGTGRRTLTRSPQWEIDAQWSPDARLLSFSRMPRSDWMHSWVWLLDPRTGHAQRIARGQSARWSPTGQVIVLDAPTASSPGDLFLVSIAGKVIRQLTHTRPLEQPTSWSPDGKHILFTRYDDAGNSDVFELEVSTAQVRRVTSDGASSGAVWSPNGKLIARTVEKNGRSRIVISDLRGGTVRALTPKSTNAFDPSW